MAPVVVFTVGHSTRTIDAFVHLLKAHGIQRVIDVRSIPRSRHNPQFGQEQLWGAVLLSVLLQFLVVYTPFLQRAFGTVPLNGGDWMFCIAVASSVLLLREITKLIGRTADRTRKTIG